MQCCPYKRIQRSLSSTGFANLNLNLTNDIVANICQSIKGSISMFQIWLVIVFWFVTLLFGSCLLSLLGFYQSFDRGQRWKKATIRKSFELCITHSSHFESFYDFFIVDENQRQYNWLQLLRCICKQLTSNSTEKERAVSFKIISLVTSKPYCLSSAIINQHILVIKCLR